MQRSNQRHLDAQVSEATGSSAEEPIGSISRRSFLAGGLAVGAGATLGPLGHAATAFATEGHGKLTRGDEAILRFLAAAEILETDLWQQYNELGGLQNNELPEGVPSVPYQKALEVLDEDLPTYIHDNAEDEKSHVAFLNAYLESRGGEPVDLSHFLTLPSSQATGARQVKRLTNLMELKVDTSYWTRYRSREQNPDLGDTFLPAVPALLKGKHPAIPRNNEDLEPEDHIQAIANTAGFHFAFIEQGGTSLYPSLAQRVTDPEVLRVLLSIGPTETMHFQTWSDKAGNAKPLTDPKNKELVFPDLNHEPPEVPGLGIEDLKTNLIMPEPTLFLKKSFPAVSIIRPTNTEGVAMGAVTALTDDGLFEKQTPEFFEVLKELAAAADAAKPKR